MSITLTSGGTALTLPADLLWADEFSWSAKQASLSYSLTGALIVQTGLKLAGRPITLQPEDDMTAWMSRADLSQAQTWNNSGAALILNIRGVARAVQFRYNETAIDARPVIHYGDTDAGDNYLVTLRLMEI